MAEALGPKLSPRAASDERVATQWRAIDRRLDHIPRRRTQRRIAWGVGGATLAAAAALFVVHVSSRPPTGTPIVAPSPSKLALSDGSEVIVDRGGRAGRIEIQKDDPREVSLMLSEGSAHFSVTHNVGRPFTVEARDVTVHVVGTEFTVAIAGEKQHESVRVTVEHGVVNVTKRTRPNETRSLRAGESWTTPVAVQGATEPTLADTTDATDPTDPSAGADVPVPEPSDKAAPRSARALFEAANQARHAGKLDTAARAYRELIARFPHDSRAQLAAFELARLELAMGRGDATSALEQAAKGPPGSSVHEDALAKLVELYQARAEWSECRRARDQYLRQYPHGIHVAVVRRSCSGQ